MMKISLFWSGGRLGSKFGVFFGGEGRVGAGE